MAMAILSRSGRATGAVLALFLLASCATQEREDTVGPAIFDPIEPANRLIFAMNDAVDTVVLQPGAFVYRQMVPSPVRDMVQNFLRWLQSPVILANDLMQGDVSQAGVTTKRFFVNGVFVGLLDMAHGMGLDYRDEDFGQTLGVHGVDGGAYIVLPLLGPSNVRDTVGKVVDMFLDPIGYIGASEPREAFQISRRVVGAIDFRERNYEAINDLKRTSVDYYARVRSIYLQQRDAAIRNGAPKPNTADAGTDNPFDDFVPSGRPGTATGELSGKTE